DFMSLPEYKRRKLATDQSGVLTPAQYNTALSVARQLPLLQLEKVFFKVVGEKQVTTSSLVQMVIKARVIPPGTTDIPPINDLDLEDVDPDEGDLDALLGRKGAKKAKVLDGSEDPQSKAEEDKPLQPALAYAPFFPRDHSPRWHVFLADSKQGKMAVPPFTFTTFNKPLFNEEGAPTFNMQTFKMQFQAPPQVGKYPFTMHLVCDSYVGMDAKRDVVLEVEDRDLNEDTLAGQLSTLKSGGAAPAPRRQKKKPQKEESSDEDDESDTEGDAGSDTSDTDTDTDGE
ncbi:MAG: hypothetical protein Q9174_005089, partial [Haloplaca sp. 1 TL-2023]